MQSRLRSKCAWISVISLAIFIGKNYFDVEVAQVDKLVEMVLVTATALGIFNNPKDKDNY